jgi:hypothetical protein
MHHPLGDALMVEVKDFLSQMKIFQYSGAALPGFERILIVGDWRSLLCRQQGNPVTRCLVELASLTPQKLLVSYLDGLPAILRCFMRHCVSFFALLDFDDSQSQRLFS